VHFLDRFRLARAGKSGTHGDDARVFYARFSKSIVRSLLQCCHRGRKADAKRIRWPGASARENGTSFVHEDTLGLRPATVEP
jgi:hypothetical protein